VKPRTADDTWIKPGKVGSRHNTIKYERPSQKDGLFLCPLTSVYLFPSGAEKLSRVKSKTCGAYRIYIGWCF
ncbi:hypothetical protein LXM26_20235, partial [Dyadobacter sp. LJ419]